jgi:uncharacterized protein YdeI (YjbR/CyaY-like superfamily)
MTKSRVRHPQSHVQVNESVPLDFQDAAEWRRWLRRNHAGSQGEWVYMYKKAAKAGLRYKDALDEALCFGWIDGQIHAVDEEKYRQRWTPRRPGSIWSQSNKARVERLMAEKRMCEAGLAAVKTARKTGKWRDAYSSRRLPRVTPEADAKQNETRQRRIVAVVHRAREGRKPGIGSFYQ